MNFELFGNRYFSLLDALGAGNVEARLVWNPSHLEPLFVEGICLPSESDMAVEEQGSIIEILARELNK